MTTPEPFALRSQRLGCLPIVNFFLARMGLAEHLHTYLPADDARLRLAPAAVIAVLVRNIVAGHRPVYALGEWAARHDPTVLGLGPGEAELLNDDRVGRTLDRLFDGDRASLITTTVLGVLVVVVDEFGIPQRLDALQGGPLRATGERVRSTQGSGRAMHVGQHDVGALARADRSPVRVDRRPFRGTGRGTKCGRPPEHPEHAELADVDRWTRRAPCSRRHIFS